MAGLDSRVIVDRGRLSEVAAIDAGFPNEFAGHGRRSDLQSLGGQFSGQAGGRSREFRSVQRR
ncbi:MAG: hypothetical protein ACP5D7_18915 [Limnospira sp.]